MRDREREEEVLVRKRESPPLYSDEVGEVDTSDAALVVIDGRELKEKSFARYTSLLYFYFDCLQKCSLQLFVHPGQTDVDGGLGSLEGEALQNRDFYIRHANIAIHECNSRRKDVKLKLVKLLKVNSALWSGINLYMTFSAVDELSGNIGIYQAALLSCAGEKVLGLFRDYSNDKILAVLSIIGAEEDLAARKKAREELVETESGVEHSECRNLEHFTALGIGSGSETMIST